MSLSTSNFSLQELEARFEMQCVENQDAGGGGYYQNTFVGDCGGGGGGGAYDYYGGSWGNHGSGDGYVGGYQTSSDGSYAILDDGTYTDGTSGDFPAYDDGSGAAASLQGGGGTGMDADIGSANLRVGINSFCVICRCRF
jgi:hypothetical protein